MTINGPIGKETMTTQQAFDYLKSLIDSNERQIQILHHMIVELQRSLNEQSRA